MSPEIPLTFRDPLSFYRIISFVKSSDSRTEFANAVLSSWRLFVVDLVGFCAEIVAKTPGVVTLCQCKSINYI